MTCALLLYVLILVAMQGRLSFKPGCPKFNMTFPRTVENLHPHPQQKGNGTVVGNSELIVARRPTSVLVKC